MSFRLSQDIVPLHYDASFEPDIPKKVFSARLLITFEIRKESDHAELFADESIKIKSVKQNGADLKYTHEGGHFHIFSDNISSAPVEILYDGSLDHFTMGWYYVNDECCSTQLESCSARLLLPCFDEPCVKSTFKISVTTFKHLTVYSNMPAASILTSTDNTKREFTFHTTPPMCTYLLAIVVGDFDCKTGFTKRGLPIDCIAPRGNADLMDLPLAEAIYAVDWLEDFLQVNFPLPRLQLIGVPEYQYGAMENFGLIIFRESCFLGKLGVTSLRALYNAAETTVHEIVHQWAGDCTSPKWWNSVWLNEGFASIMPFIIIAEEHPDWNFMMSYHVKRTEPALVDDGVVSSHPIVTEVNSPQEIESIFDSISYSKAAAVIYMLMHHLSMDKIRSVLRVFYKKYYYKCADTEDFIATFNETLNEDFTTLIKSWTTQTGYPLITFNEDGTLTQARFTTSGTIDGPVWPIPLCLLRKKKGSGEIVEEKIMFDTKTASIANFVNDSEWIKLNPEYKVLCRVWYRGSNLTNLFAAIKDKSLGTVDRWSVLNDSVNAAKAGLMPYGDVIKLFEVYSNEDERLAINPMIQFFCHILLLFPTLKEEIQKMGRNLFGSILERIGRNAQPGESSERAQLRGQLLSMLAFNCNDKETQEYGLKQFNIFRQTRKFPDGFDPNQIPFVLRAGSYLSKDANDFLWDVSRTEINPEIQSSACIAIGFGPLDIAEENMLKCLSAKKQDVINFLAGFCFHPDIGDRFYNFFKKNYEIFYKMFGGMAFNLPSTFEYAAGHFVTNEKADDLEAFFKEHPIQLAEPCVKTLVENIRSRAKTAAAQYESVKSVFSQ